MRLLHCLLLTAIGLVTAAAPVAAESVVRIVEAHRYVGEARPDREESWEAIRLPQQLGEQVAPTYDESITVWIRIKLPAMTSDGLPQALYIPRHNMSAAVFAGALYLGGTDKRVMGQRPMGWNIPLLLDLPQLGEAQGRRFVYVKLESGPSGVLLAPVLVGKRAELQARYDQRYFMQVSMSKIALVICALMGVLSCWLWLRRQNDRLYLRFATLCVCYCVQSSFGFISFIPIDLRLWLTVVHIAGDWSNYLLVSFVVIALGANFSWLVRGLFWLAVAATMVHLIVPDAWFLPTAYGLLLIGDVLVYAFGAWVVFRTVQLPITANAWFGIAFIGMFIFSAHDFYGVFLAPPEVHAEISNWTPFSLPLLALAFYSHLLNRFVTALDSSEELNARLAAASEEKQKLYRDLHDDVGARLLSIVHGDETRSRHLALEALETIRVTLYSVNHGNETAGDFMRAVVEEIDLRLSSVGVISSSHFSAGEDRVLDAEVAYHLKRIVREVISNIVHHAQASAVTTRICLEDGKLEIEIMDDGAGLKNNGVENNGLKNIRYRAEQIGARFDLCSGGAKTNFTLTMGL